MLCHTDTPRPLFFHPVVSGQGIGEKAVFLFRSRADVVYDERRSVCRLFVAHDHDVRKPSSDDDGHEIARFVVGRLLSRLEAPTIPLEEALEVRHTAMVDVGVCPLEPPLLRVLREVGLHVLMDEFLQIDLPCIAQRAYDYVRADA